MKCKICKTNPEEIHGGYCQNCIVAYQAGERAGITYVVNQIRQQLNEVIRNLEAMSH